MGAESEDQGEHVRKREIVEELLIRRVSWIEIASERWTKTCPGLSGTPKENSHERLLEFAAGRYIAAAENGIAIGNSGTGKTHLATAPGVAACNQGKRVRSHTAIELASELEATQEDHEPHRLLARFAK